MIENRTGIKGNAMDRGQPTGVLGFAAGLLLGVAVGASIALLAAPQSGRRTRRALRRAVEDGLEDAGDRWESLNDDVRSAVQAGRRRVGH